MEEILIKVKAAQHETQERKGRQLASFLAFQFLNYLSPL